MYDILVFHFLKVCAHYDPLYPKKTEKVCKFIESKPADETLRVEDISAAVGFDSAGCVRVLVRGDYLETVQGPKKVTLGYKRGPNWAPPAKFFQLGSMGFVGFAQRFFRWYLRNYILDRMGELESTEHVLQLDHIRAAERTWTKITASAPPIHISKMDEKWIRQTEDYLEEAPAALSGLVPGAYLGRDWTGHPVRSE